MTRILSIIGQQGSGKSTLGKMIAETLNAQFIEASDVVREIRGPLARSEMPKTNEETKSNPNWLGDAIKARIKSDKVIISGIREKEVHHSLSKIKDGRLLVISLWAPQQERYARVKRLGKVETFGDFITHEHSELEIGLRELLLANPPKYATTEHIQVEEVAEMIIDGLSRGWKLFQTHLQ